MNWIYDAKVIRVVDSSIAWFELSKVYSYSVDFGFRIQETIMARKTSFQALRLLGLDKFPLMNREHEAKAKKELERLLGLGALQVETQKEGLHYLATVHVVDSTGQKININRQMLMLDFLQDNS